MNSVIPIGALATALLAAPVPAALAGDVDVHISIDGPRRGHAGARYAWQRGYERGLRDGYGKGAEDARKHRRYDLWRHSRFRSARAGYRGRYGPRPAYSDGYRAGFAQSYERAFARGHRGRDRYDRRWDDDRGRHRGRDRYDRRRDDRGRRR